MSKFIKKETASFAIKQYRKKTCWILGIFLILYMVFFVLIINDFFDLNNYSIIVDYKNEEKFNAQMYYDTGWGFNQVQCMYSSIDDGELIFEISNDISNDIVGLRFDPAEFVDDIYIKNIIIKNNFNFYKTIPVDKFDSYINGTENIINMEMCEGSLLHIHAGVDPQIFLNEKIFTELARLQKKSYIIILTGLFIVFILLVLMRNVIFNWIKRVYYFFANSSIISKVSPIRIVLYFLSLIIIIISWILTEIKDFLLAYFNKISFEEIVFHLKLSMEGVSDSMIMEFFKGYGIKLLLFMVILAFFVIIIIKNKLYKKRALGNCILIVSFLLSFILCVTTVIELNIHEYLRKQYTASEFIEKEYVDPDGVVLKWPDERKNLIYIFLESMETTFSSNETGGAMNEDLIPELTSLAEKNICFAQDNVLGGAYVTNGTNWTVGAMVAQTSGIPLLIPIDGNSYGYYNDFLPGAKSIGDILHKQGYNQEIMVGSDINFGGRNLFFSQHGEYIEYDYKTAIENNKIPSDYFEWWGFEDAKLYSYAKEEILSLAEKDEPFNFTLLTADTHHVGGYLCDLCENESSVQYEKVLHCASRQLNNFIGWIQEQDFYENTVIVIVGDHLTMDNNYISQYYNGSAERKVFNCFINADLDELNSCNREFTTLDMFPTTLSALGVKIEGNKMGLGTDLFSGEPTLVEKYGIEYIDEEFRKNSNFYKKHILGE